MNNQGDWKYEMLFCFSTGSYGYVYILLIIRLSHLFSRYKFLGSRLFCFAAEGARTKRGRTEHRAKWKLSDGGSWPKEHEKEDMKVNDHENWDMMKDG